MADNKNVIPNGLTASKMRNRMEDKNTLAQKGSMYAGTGVMGENGAAVTTFTPPPSENTLLVKDNTQEGGLNWKNVSDVINNAKTAGQIINANNADKATISTNVENIIATEQAYPNIVSFSIGDKSYSKTVNHVENAKAINRSIGNNEEITLLHAEGSTDGFNLKWASGENAGTLTIETTDDANSQIRFLQNDVQVLQAIDGKCNINGNANSATYATNAGTANTIYSYYISEVGQGLLLTTTFQTYNVKLPGDDGWQGLIVLAIGGSYEQNIIWPLYNLGTHEGIIIDNNENKFIKILYKISGGYVQIRLADGETNNNIYLYGFYYIPLKIAQKLN